MFQVSDSTPDGATQVRREWMSVLARSPLDALESGLRRISESGSLPGRVWLRRPETGLVMVRGRIGGGGERFNLGEMTVTRCSLRVETGEVGVAYVNGRSHRKCEIAALSDALLQGAAWRDVVQRLLVEPLRSQLEVERESLRRKAQATRVEFFTLAREAATAPQA